MRGGVVGADGEPLAVLVGQLRRAARLRPGPPAVVRVGGREVDPRVVELAGEDAAGVYRYDVDVGRRAGLTGERAGGHLEALAAVVRGLAEVARAVLGHSAPEWAEVARAHPRTGRV